MDQEPKVGDRVAWKGTGIVGTVCRLKMYPDGRLAVYFLSDKSDSEFGAWSTSIEILEPCQPEEHWCSRCKWTEVDSPGDLCRWCKG